MSKRNKAVTRQLIEEVWSRGNYDIVDGLVASDFIGHSFLSDSESHMKGPHGPDGYKQFYVGLRKAFPDLQFTVKDQIAEGDKVVTRWAAQGTHQGELQGMPPTGKQSDITGITIDRLANGRR